VHERTALIEILCEFIRLVTGQIEDLSVGLQNSYKKAKKNLDQSMRSDLEELPPFTVVLDSTYWVDEPSWIFLELIC
jgi:hypothetical protein